MRTPHATLAALACVAATTAAADTIPGFTWKGKPNFPGFARGMAAGPDGNLWVTDADANAVGRVAQDGTVTDGYKLGTYTAFPIPTADSFPVAITVGPDGALWFVEGNNGGKLGRCTTSGAITEFPLPGPSGGFPSIASGPDGNLWLTGGPYDAAHVSRILKVTTQGAATAYPLAAGVGVGTIVAGGDGNLWFVERTSSAVGIGRITPGGAVTDFWLPTKSSQVDLTLGQDGNVWFTESNASAIGRITPAGAITEFPIPSPSTYPAGIASGTDGNIYFTEYDAHKIGELVLATATAQGQATFHDSGSYSVYQAVALVALPPPTSSTLVAARVRGLGADPTPTPAGGSCPQPTFIVRESSSADDNAEEIAASAPDTCADVLATQSVAVRWQYCWEFFAKLRNDGPDPATNVTLRAQFSAATPVTFSNLNVRIGSPAGSPPAPSCGTLIDQVTCTVPTLAPQAEVDVNVKIDGGDQLPCKAIPIAGRQRMVGFAVASADTPDPNVRNNVHTALYGTHSTPDSNEDFHGVWLIGLPLDALPGTLHVVSVTKRGSK